MQKKNYKTVVKCRMITTLESATFMDGFRTGQNVLIIAQKMTDSDMFGRCSHLILMREAPKIQSNFFCGKWPKSKILGFGLKNFYHWNNMAETGCCECQTAGCSQFIFCYWRYLFALTLKHILRAIPTPVVVCIITPPLYKYAGKQVQKWSELLNLSYIKQSLY